MSAAAIVSVEDYLRRTEKPYCEYVEGVLIPKPMPTTLHAWIQSVLVLLFAKQGKLGLTELTIPVAPDVYYIPDVAVVRKLEFPYPSEPALLCVEILSPGDRIGSTLAKCEKYHAWGTPTCWVIDPVKRSAWMYDAGADPVPVTDVLVSGDIAVSLDELFANLPAV